MLRADEKALDVKGMLDGELGVVNKNLQDFVKALYDPKSFHCCSCGATEAEEETVVRAVMVGGSGAVISEVIMEFTTVGPVPGNVEESWYLGLERFKPAAVWGPRESAGSGEIFSNERRSQTFIN